MVIACAKKSYGEKMPRNALVLVPPWSRHYLPKDYSKSPCHIKNQNQPDGRTDDPNDLTASPPELTLSVAALAAVASPQAATGRPLGRQKKECSSSHLEVFCSGRRDGEVTFEKELG